MNVARLLFAFMSLLSLSAVAEPEFPSADDFCPMSPSHQILSCQGTFHAHTEADLDEIPPDRGIKKRLRSQFAPAF